MTTPARLAVLLTLALTLVACIAQPKSGDVLLVDDFSKTESGFNRQSDADAITDYLDGEYQIHIFTPNLNVWAVSGPKFTDAIVEVNARTSSGSENNLFGVICRLEDDSNFYFFAISADSYYAIGKLKDGAIVLLSSSVFEYSDKILSGQAVNHVVATCAGTTLTLNANGTQLAQITDGDFTEGQIGFIAGTFDDPETDVRFDNLLVTKP